MTIDTAITTGGVALIIVTLIFFGAALIIGRDEP